MSDICQNKDFIAMVERSIVKITNAITDSKKADNDKLKIENEKYVGYEKNRRIFLWQRFILSLFVIALLGLSAACSWLSKETIVPLLTGVIASLFIVPKKD